jgi:hypothetical protein
MYRKGEEVPVQDKIDTEFSWLGRWKDNGWSIRIEPRLKREEWDPITVQLDSTWNATLMNYDAMASMELLERCLPKHELTLMWPRCGKKITQAREGKLPIVGVCGQVARFNVPGLLDAYDNKTVLARCEVHRGQI